MDLKDLRESLAGVLGSECGPDRAAAYVNGKLDLEAALGPVASELGWFGLCVPEADGGLGLGDAALCVAAEEFGRALAPASLATMLLAGPLLAQFAPEGLRDRYLEAAIEGRLRAGIDVSLVRSDRSGKQPMVLGCEDADFLLIGLPDDAAEPDLALVELEGATGRIVRQQGWDGTRDLCLARLDGLPVHRLGPDAHRQAVRRMALLLAADSLGLSEAILTRTIEYLCLREQFGKKLATFQALKHRVADLRIDQVLHRSLIEVASQENTSGLEAGVTWPLLCKAEVTDGAARATGECLQLHGAIGFTWEHHCHLYLKRARLNQALLADNDALRRDCGALLPAVLKMDAAMEERRHAV